MPAKLNKNFSNENPDLGRQIGCVTGIFQLFDGRRFLSGRHLNCLKHKNPPSGKDALLNSGRNESEPRPCSSEILQEKNLTNYLYENGKASTESSRASCSSSSSSSFSSLEFNKSSQKDARSFDRAFFSDMSRMNSSIFMQLDGEFKSTNSPPVARKLNNHAYKHEDSPRPSLPGNLDEAIRIVIELKKAPWRFTDLESKDASFTQELQRTPRFSLDGRENSKSCNQVRELPRLSLDSRQGPHQKSISTFASRTSLPFEDLDRASSRSYMNRASNLLQDLSSKRRHPSVVEKLMGLEDMAELSSPAQTAVTRQNLVTKNAQISQSVQRRDSILTKTAQGNRQSERSPKASKPLTKASDTHESFRPPVVIMKPVKTIDIANASTHSMMQLEGLSTLPKVHIRSIGREKSHAGITTDRRSTASNNSPRCQSNSTLRLGENVAVSPRASGTRSPRPDEAEKNKKRRAQAEKVTKCRLGDTSPASNTSGGLPLHSTAPRQRRRKPSEKKLLEEVCSEIEDCVELIYKENILHPSEGWENFGSEKTKVAMQIESLLLQDLIDEVVGEAGAQAKTSKFA
ncbi:uncharacterized protein LOC121984426 isoform X1 [Zingiber officinale]|uniref:uncharacterized protein LOC121984426 isoform X1 n=1 Tax=Zingiber officinale TaxID=94328 RepID=UPI001C4C1BB7|nr:uncharacterized protein LOC121984426 isoform X1 [Zingiber officinale]